MRKGFLLAAIGALVGLASQAQALPAPGLTWDYYAGINGGAVSDLTSSTAYINHTPTSTSTISSFETGTNIADYYGSAVYGYFTPTQTGNYYFGIASDDNSALYLSTDSNPANVSQVVANGGWGNSRQYSNHSGAVPLVAGTSYYILGLMKENNGGDNFAVTASFGTDTIVDGQDPLGAGTAAPLGAITTSIPEPASLALLGASACGMLLRRRKA